MTETLTDGPSAVDTPGAGRLPRRAVWRRLQMAAGCAAGASLVVPMLLAGKVESFLLAMAAPFLVGVVLSVWLPRTGAIVLGVVSLAILGMSAPFIVGALTHPEAMVDFISTWVFVLATAVGVVAATPAYREAGGRVVAPGAARSLGFGTAALALISVVVSVVAAAGVDAVAAQPGDIEVQTEDFAFAPGTLEVDAGEVAVHVTNVDSTRHTFTIDGVTNVSIPPNSAKRVTFEAAPGTYRFYCEPHAADMDGQLMVK